MDKFWRATGNFADYKTPISDGEILHSPQLLREGFELDPESLKLRFMRRGKRENRVLGSFTAWRPGILTPEREVFEILRPLIEPSARCFDVNIGKRPYVICIVNRKLDAFDRTRSRFQRFGEDEDLTDCTLSAGSGVNLRKIFLKSNFQTDAYVFRLEGEPPLQLEIIVSDEFYQTYHAHKLTGLIFQSVGQ
ncbi:imm11 family protein [Neorhizobium galegae]|uniref:imm11 family protein n=1 Tax=Neorhizobium galegae TaxID=399 RepID=UPI001F2EC3FF|nr:DUF1629 domain-containing protein [Neorhizobium galegae]UIK06820.1 hypothetical protein LZK81_07600 [Neorhizobium galegae]